MVCRYWNRSFGLSATVRARWVVGRCFRHQLIPALLNWVGAEFMIKGYLSYPQMLQVFNLVLFALTFGAATLDFSKPAHGFKQHRPASDSSPYACQVESRRTGL